MKRRTLFWLLAASVGLNLFLAGFWVARALRHRDFEQRRSAEMFHVGRALRGSKVAGVREKARAHMQRARPLRRELRAARAQVKRALEAETYNHTELESALQRLRAKSADVQEALHEALLDVADGLSVEERRALGEANWSPRRQRPHVRRPGQ